MTDDTHTANPADRLRAVVKQLSLAGVEAVGPEWRADGLAIEFDEAYTVFVDRLVELPSVEQLRALQVIDDQLHSMSAPDQKQLWEAAAVKSDPVWESVRAMSRLALLAFGWID